MVTNPEVIAVDQDALGLQCIKVDETTAGLQVWAKPLAASGSLAVLLLNRTNSSAPIPVHWSDLGLDTSVPVTVRDPWAHKDLGRYTAFYTAEIPAEDAVMLIVKGKEGEATRYDHASSGNKVAGGAAPGSIEGCPDGQSAPLAGEIALTFEGVTSKWKSAYIQIAYTNGGKAPRLAELRLNGQITTRIAFPSTGGEHTVGSITIEAPLELSRANYVLTFSSPCAMGPSIVWIAVVSGPHEYGSRP